MSISESGSYDKWTHQPVLCSTRLQQLLLVLHRIAFQHRIALSRSAADVDHVGRPVSPAPLTRRLRRTAKLLRRNFLVLLITPVQGEMQDMRQLFLEHIIIVEYGYP